MCSVQSPAYILIRKLQLDFNMKPSASSKIYPSNFPSQVSNLSLSRGSVLQPQIPVQHVILIHIRGSPYPRGMVRISVIGIFFSFFEFPENNSDFTMTASKQIFIFIFFLRQRNTFFSIRTKPPPPRYD